MALGIQERKATVEKNIIIGDIEYYKGEEFINRIKDQYHDDDSVCDIISKIKKSDQFRLSHMFAYVPLGTNLYKSEFEMSGRYTGWNI